MGSLKHVVALLFWVSTLHVFAASSQDNEEGIRLPAAETDGTYSVERAMQGRRSIRQFTTQALTRKHLAQLRRQAGGTGQGGVESGMGGHNALVLLFTAVPQRTKRKYGAESTRYILIEVGHAAQNVLLQAQALNIGASVVGAFDTEAVTRIVQLPGEESPVYLLVAGRIHK